MTTTPEIRTQRRWAAWAGAILVLSGAAIGLLAHDRDGETLPGADAPSSIVLAGADEPGRRLVVQGQVFAPDGETTVEGVVLYVYHTDASGRYAPPGERVPRLRGWVRTDRQGRYEYRTIRPGAYPGRQTEEHVHVFLWGAGYEPQWTEGLLFADDPLVGREEIAESRSAGRFAHVCAPTQSGDGALLCTHDIRLKPHGDRLPEEVRHAFQPADRS